jgi:hypothetical protein
MLVVSILTSSASLLLLVDCKEDAKKRAAPVAYRITGDYRDMSVATAIIPRN